VLQDLLALPEVQGRRVLLDRQARQQVLVYLETRDLLDLPVQPVHRVPRVVLDRVEPLVLRVVWVHQVL